ncbi:MAG: PKD domain-containing protein [Spirochaetales bacterium]|nr:PKD domain-containing protein [Spirochaetales bacterium]
MQELLHTQRVRGRGKTDRPRTNRKHKRSSSSHHRSRRQNCQVTIFQPSADRAVVSRALSTVGRFCANLFRRNRYLFVTACGLFLMAATGLVFSMTLQQSLAKPRAAADAGTEDVPADVSSRALTAAYDELGAGSTVVTRNLVRDKDVEYTLQEGDSLYSIGKLYVVSARDLQDFNRITDPNRLRIGATIVIPSKDNLEKFMRKREAARLALKAARASVPPPASLLPSAVVISANTVKDGALFTAELKPETALPSQGVYYLWDLGDGSVARTPAATYRYVEPGTYTVSLTVRDTYGYEVKSNDLSIEVGSGEAANLHRTMYLTVNAVGDTFALPARVSQIDDYLGREEKPIQFVEERDGSCFYRALAAGNYSLIARGGETTYKIYLFISPYPSVQNDRYDVDWYRTQYNTGSSNCGPASVSMAVGWAKGIYVSVTAVRNYLGFQGDGSTSFPQLERALAWRGVKTRTVDMNGIGDIFAAIDRGEVVIILFHTARISKVRGRADLNYVGRYYADRVGHYVVVKGYTTDKKYLTVYDPLPSDWTSNGSRYGDGISMIGRNRFYSVAEMRRALSVPKMLVISK